MLIVDSQTYYNLKLDDLVDIKCDNCNLIFQKTKKNWYYTAHVKGSGVNFQQKSFCCKECKHGFTSATKRKTYQCLQCGCEFVGLMSQDPKFCKQSCAAIFNNNKRGRKKLVNCKLCSIDFSVCCYLTQKSYTCNSCKKIKPKKLVKPKNQIAKLKNCKNCSVELYSERRIQYCSLKCKKQANKKHIKICLNCNCEYKAEKISSTFCSRSCRSVSLKLHSYAHKRSGLSRSKIECYIEGKLSRDFPDLTILYNDKNTINSELDIYIPGLKMAFELNGVLHYIPIYGEDNLQKIQSRDKNKATCCEEMGIELVTVNLGNCGFTKRYAAQIYEQVFNLIDKNKNRIKCA